MTGNLSSNKRFMCNLETGVSDSIFSIFLNRDLRATGAVRRIRISGDELKVGEQLSAESERVSSMLEVYELISKSS